MSQTTNPISGYIYIADEDTDGLAAAAPGVIVRNPKPSPPWRVVDHSLERVIVARWPGRLWEAIVLDAEGVPQASADANYTRAVAIQIGDEVPTWRLFGEHGQAVCTVLAVASALDVSIAWRLTLSRHPQADQAYSRAWRRWLLERGEKVDDDEDYSGTLAAGNGPVRSPFGGGLSVVLGVVWKRAESVVGSAARVEHDEGEWSLLPPWRGAADALLDAAMAFGAPSLVSDADAVILTTAWREAFS